MSHASQVALYLFPVIPLVVLLFWASLHDFIARTLPNQLIGAVAALSLVAGAMDGTALLGLSASALVFVFAATLWRLGFMGGGDVKLLGATALGITPMAIPEFITAIALAGGLLSLMYLLAKRILPPPPAAKQSLRSIPRILRIEQWRIHRGCPLPYACAIAAGTLYVHL